MQFLSSNLFQRSAPLKRGLTLALQAQVVSLMMASMTCHAEQVTSDLMDSPLTLSLAKTARLASRSNAVIVDQYGVHNTTHINQAADSSNLIDVAQSGTHNYAMIIQRGIGNTVELFQSGHDNALEVIQEGDFNSANIHQLSEQRFVVHQIGNDMVVNIIQYKK